MKAKLLTLVLLAGPCLTTATAGGDDAKKELEKLQGTWRLIYEEDSGQKIPVNPTETFTFTKDNLKNHIGRKLSDEFSVRINLAATPMLTALSVANTIGLLSCTTGQGPFLAGAGCLAGRNKAMDLRTLKECCWVPAPAIFKIEGNKLTLCINFTSGASRPVAFQTNQTNRNIILILEKVKAQRR